MKKILLALAILASVQVANAQTNPAAAKKAVEAAEAATQNAKKAVNPTTWVKLGQAYMEAYNAPAGNAWVGADQTSLQLAMTGEKPSSTETVVLNGQQYTKQVYKEKNLYINGNGVLEIIEVTAPVVADPLSKSLAAYKKAAEVDAKGSKTKDITAGIKTVAEKFVTEAYASYSLGNMEAAEKYFEDAFEASTTKPYAQVDTNSLYNAAFTSWSLGKNEQAKAMFEKCLTYNYYGDNGEVYAKLADCAAKIDTSKAGAEAGKNYLEEGFVKFPGSQSILIGLINYYVTSGQDTERLFELLDGAKKNEPNNPSLYYVEGNIRAKLGQNEQAVKAYEDASKISPDYEYGYIGEGILYYNEALALQDKAQNEMDDAKYNALMEEFDTTLKKCIDPFEKAYAICKDDAVKSNIAEYLKNVYYRFREQDPAYQAGFDKYSALLK